MMVVQLAGERAVKSAEKSYKEAMMPVYESLPVAEHELHAAHVAAQTTALKTFGNLAREAGKAAARTTLVFT